MNVFKSSLFLFCAFPPVFGNLRFLTVLMEKKSGQKLISPFTCKLIAHFSCTILNLQKHEKLEAILKIPIKNSKSKKNVPHNYIAPAGFLDKRKICYNSYCSIRYQP